MSRSTHPRWSRNSVVLGTVAAMVVGQGRAADRAVLASGPFPQLLTLQSVSPGTAASAVTAPAGPIALLDLGLSGWLAQRGLDDEIPRLVELAPGYGYRGILLPGDVGGLVVHYSRQGGAIFGFLRARPDGSIQIVLERPGVGPQNNDSPFDPVIAVAPDGEALAISGAVETLLSNQPPHLWIIDLEDATPITTDVIPPGSGVIPGTSLTLDDDFLLAIRGAGVLFAELDENEPATVLALEPAGQPAPAYVLPEIALAPSGTAAVVLGGVDEQNLHMYAIDIQNLAVNRLTAAPSWLLGPGSSLSAQKAPFLALDDAGTTVAYQVRNGTSSTTELFLRNLTPGAQPEHVTADTTFDPYIDNVSGILTVASRFAFFAWGGYTSSADLYATSFQAVGPPGHATINITNTSGTPLPPFADASQITVAEHQLVQDLMLIADDQQLAGAGYRFWVVDELQQALPIVSGLLAPPQFDAPHEDGPAIVGRFELPNLSAIALLPTETEGTSLLPQPVLFAPSPIVFRTVRIDRTGTRVALVAEVAPQVVYVAQLSLVNFGITVAPGGPFFAVDEVDFGAGGGLYFTTRDASQFITAHAFDPVSGAVTRSVPSAFSFWLR